jgi:hypothetical protein
VDGTPPPPTVSIADASATEGSALSFEVSLSSVAATDVTVTATTAAGSAGAGDFTARTAAVTIPAGQLSAPFAVETLTDELDENDETLTVSLSEPSGATIADGTSLGTIVDDDQLPAVSIGDGSGEEGADVVLPVSLATVSGRPVTARVTTTPDTASSSDFTGARQRARDHPSRADGRERVGADDRGRRG